VYRPQPKRKRNDMTMNPLWARYMQQQGGPAAAQFTPILCRPPMPSSNATTVVSSPVSSLSHAIDRAKLIGNLLYLTILLGRSQQRVHEIRTIATDVPVAWCVCHAAAPYKSCCTDRGPLWGGEWRLLGPKEHSITRGSRFPPRIRCGLCQITLTGTLPLDFYS